VYRHFPTKEALFEAIVLHRIRDMIDQVRARAEADDPGAAFYRTLTDLVEQNSMKRDLSDALAGAGRDLTESLSQARQQMRDALGVLLRRAQTAGAVRPDVDVVDLTILLAAVFLAAQERMPHKALAIIRDGLRPPP
jgi:AcrR family transcriptional regulator